MVMGTETSRLDDYLTALRREFPTLRLVSKTQDRGSKQIDRFLKLITFGSQSEYLSSYTTTLGSTLYLPACWDQLSQASRYLILRHEAVHLRQFRRYGFLGMALLYLIPILPLGLALGRARLEWAAYRETILATAEVHGLAAAANPALRRTIVEQFVGPAYGWMWPFPQQVHRWVDEALAELRASSESAGVQ